MSPTIKQLPAKKLIGMRQRTTHGMNNAPELWKQFMPRRNEITNAVGIELYSVQHYDEVVDINKLNPETLFYRWAAKEVTDFNHIPDGMLSLTLGGLYAVFPFKGTPAMIRPLMEFIHREWLPTSGYLIDHRPHFEILGEKYQRESRDSEEDICIPIELRNE